MDISAIRKEYTLQTLNESDVDKSPIVQFSKWWSQALNSHIEEVNAMALATTDSMGRPSARIVLLKGFDKNGFVFYTNYDSRKGKEIAMNPFASVVLFWKELERQIRIEGVIKKTDEQESEAYFSSRPLESRIGAWASPQSEVVSSRLFLEDRFKILEKQWSGAEVPKPPHWGGYCLMPDRIEFWQGRPGRLHDRILYVDDKNGNWNISRLAP